jgi:pyridoxal phosphate enzyme (YggS family)
MTIEENVIKVREKIKESALKVNKKVDDIELVAVTKYVDSDVISDLYKNGLNTFGESKVQDFLKKFEDLNDKDITWHFIGHLQRNKIKYIYDKVDLLHSADSIKLIEDIDNICKKNNKILDILLQVNISNEQNKYGFKKNDLINSLNGINNYQNVKIKGLMAMASNTDNKDIIRNEFKEMKNLFDYIKKMNLQNVKMEKLSLGMSRDFDIAIEEKANIVRIGNLLTKSL